MSFNIELYQGKFYEIYKQNAWFEIGCQAATTNYELTFDKKHMKVLNFCYSDKGTGQSYTLQQPNLRVVKTITGLATPTEDPLILDLQFDSGHRGIYEIFYTDYFYSIVGTLSYNYLSILSSEPYIPYHEILKLQDIAKSYGFTIDLW